ncbi:unnamed protein product [Dibothriocephalus latus]|uniref:AAA ATPase AAA+ lid domain-containing protein n=1 Tax=Dibothriocephalus latus TaxID=60516 RepID=A0A3P7L8P3_DIBLA|nr:unnamed protein product [Dibothriocephalus latus]
MTEGYSGSDIRLVCKEAAMSVVRKIFEILEDNSGKGLKDTKIRLETITTAEVERAIASTMPSARGFAAKYKDWQEKYGSV